jgi:hypothetical protein
MLNDIKTQLLDHNYTNFNNFFYDTYKNYIIHIDENIEVYNFNGEFLFENDISDVLSNEFTYHRFFNKIGII